MALSATCTAFQYGCLLKIILCSSLVLFIPTAGSTQDEEKPALNILGLFSLTGTRTLAGNSAKLVAELAIEQVNRRTDILPNHTLKMFWEDSQVSFVCVCGNQLDGIKLVHYRDLIPINLTTRHFNSVDRCSRPFHFHLKLSPQAMYR